MTPKIKAALKCIESRGVSDATWKMQAELIKAGITVAMPLELLIEKLERRRPRARHKAEKEQIACDLKVLQLALDEVLVGVAQQNTKGGER